MIWRSKGGTDDPENLIVLCGTIFTFCTTC
ncbi:MAG: hypothetical protein AB9903_31780 [Vulcanimicrobiota bacterium]